MYTSLRRQLFRLDPELVHGATLQLLRLVGKFPFLADIVRSWFQAPSLPVRAFGLDFANPVGLAAGYDKDGLAWRGLACLGFGHIEIGTVTPLPQEGNPRPRLFRLPEDQALINRMGFPGRGAEFVAGQFRGRRPAGLVLGVNLGKNRDTPLEEAGQDYRVLLHKFASLADYLAINVSSPNTTGLRRLQGRQALDNLLAELTCACREEEARLGRNVPLLIKLAPDLTDAELDDALDVILQRGLDGVIACNTTLARDGLRSPRSFENGGLSGAPLRVRSHEMVQRIYEHTQGRLPVVGVGGIMDAKDARQFLEAGAILVQVYTGLVYCGPDLVRHIMLNLKNQTGTV